MWDAQKLKALEEESRRLKKLLAASMPDVAALKDPLEKTDRAGGASECRAPPDGRARFFSAAPASRSGSIPRPCAVSPILAMETCDLRERLRRLAAERRRFGCRRLGVLLKREGIRMNRKKRYRLQSKEGLAVRRRRDRKRATGTRAPMALPDGPTQCWSLDFVSGAAVLLAVVARPPCMGVSCGARRL